MQESDGLPLPRNKKRKRAIKRQPATQPYQSLGLDKCTNARNDHWGLWPCAWIPLLQQPSSANRLLLLDFLFIYLFLWKERKWARGGRIMHIGLWLHLSLTSHLLCRPCRSTLLSSTFKQWICFPVPFSGHLLGWPRSLLSCYEPVGLKNYSASLQIWKTSFKDHFIPFGLMVLAERER